MQTPKSFIFIFGPQAVGKMAVAQALSQRLDYRFLYNHQTIDVAEHLYERPTPEFIRFLWAMNRFVFTKFIQTPSSNGLIYSDVWMLNRNYDNEMKNRMFTLFASNQWNVYLVELEASLARRLERNSTSLRLTAKPAKANLQYSETHIRNAEYNQILNTRRLLDWKVPQVAQRHIYINNEDKTIEETVNLICKQLS